MRRMLRVVPPTLVLAAGASVPSYFLPNGWRLFEVALGLGVPALLVANHLRPQADFAVVAAVITVLATSAAFFVWVALNPLY
jgi:hypothetical protein